MTPSDSADRHALTEGDLDTPFFVEAAAGTGKTRALVERAVALLRSGRATVDQLALVTFSNEAAGQLQLRLREALDVARASETDAEARGRLEKAIQNLEDAAIDTLHGFCGRILRARPIEAGVDPEPRVGPNADRLRRKVLKRWLEDGLTDPPPGLARFLARFRFDGGADGGSPLDPLDRALAFILDRRDLDAPWPGPETPYRPALEAVTDTVRDLAETVAGVDPDHPLRSRLAPVIEAAEQLEETLPLDELEGLLAVTTGQLKEALRPRQSWKAPSRFGTCGPNLPAKTVLAKAEAALDALEHALAVADQDLCARLREELRPVAARYLDTARRTGELGYTDVLTLTRDLLARDPTVVAELRARYPILMVDEFQDTEPVQAEVVLRIAGDAGTLSRGLVLVGDPKQSIYGFRRADLRMYRQTRDALLGGEVRHARLRTSHRAVAPIQRFVNLAFGKAFASDPANPEYIPLEGGPDPLKNQPAVVALPARQSLTEWGKLSSRTVRASLDRDIPAFVAWLVKDSGWSVRGDDGAPRPVEPSDVCLLFRNLANSYQLFFDRIQAQLERFGVDTVLVGNRSLHARDEVAALVTVATALEWPRDELAVYGALRGPLFGFEDGALLAYRERVARLNPFSRVPDGLRGEDAQIADALASLRELSQARNRRPHVETLRRLIGGDRTRGAIGFALADEGRRALSNLELALEIARAHDTQGGSFRATVQALEEAAQELKSNDGALNVKAAPGVRLMTVHQAKGLEFPVVVLADPTRGGEPRVGALDLPEEGIAVCKIAEMTPRPLAEAHAAAAAESRREELRVAYVAATRARDLLVVPTVREQVDRIVWQGRSWLHPVLDALVPPRGARASPIPGGPPPPAAPPRAPAGQIDLEPGLPVAWWDVRTLPPDPPEAKLGMAGLDWLTEGPLDAPNRERHARWLADRARAREDGMMPSITLVGLEAAPPGATPLAAPRRLVDRLPGPRDPRRFGRLVHGVARDLPLERPAPADRAAGLVRYHARTLEATEAEIAAALEVFDRLLDDPLLARARAAEAAWRAFPVVSRTELGEVVHTAVDLLFREPHGYTAVDFVTGDRRQDAAMAKMQHARAALEAGGMTPVVGCLLLRLD